MIGLRSVVLIDVKCAGLKKTSKLHNKTCVSYLPLHIPQSIFHSVWKHEVMVQDDINALAGIRELEEQFERLMLEQQKEFEKKLERSRLEQQKEFEKKLEKLRLEQQKEFEEKNTFKYWDTFDDLWSFDLTEYKGLYQETMRLRQDHTPQIYRDVRTLLMDDTGIETVLQENSMFSITVPWSEVDEESMEKRYDLKDFLGHKESESEISKAHAFPNDPDCNLYWWPMLRMVTGINSTDLNRSALDKVAAMKTNKIVFPGRQHKKIYDDLEYGVVCTIPIFDSMKEMATTWSYGQGYEMLIVCDSADTYEELKMNNDGRFPHISVASPEDVANATNLVAEMTKVLADSLVSNWDSHYNDLDNLCERKKMLKNMKDILTDDNQERVHIPVIKKPTEDVKLYKIDYGILYDGDPEGQKYIPDPLPALIKSAINLSTFVNKTHHQHDPEKQGCKLLPACACLRDYDSKADSSATDILDLLPQYRLGSEFPSMVGYRPSHEASSDVVSNDELERDHSPDDDDVGDDDVKSVISDLTGV